MVYFLFFRLVENYDYFELVEIFSKLIQNTVMNDPAVIEILMIILLKDDVITSSEKDEHYDSIAKINLFKRQISSSSSNSKQSEKIFVRYLGMATSLLSRVDVIHPNVITEITNVINHGIHAKFHVTNDLADKILHFTLYCQENPKSLRQRVLKNGKKYGVSTDITVWVYCLESISNSIKGIKVLLELMLKNTKLFNRIKGYFNLNSRELIGMMYFILGDFQDDKTYNFLNVISKKRAISEYNEKKIIDILTLLASSDKSMLKKSFMRIGLQFPVQKIKFFQFFIYFKGLVTLNDKSIAEFYEIFDYWPSNKFFDKENKFKELFTECINTKNIIQFKYLKEKLLYYNFGKANKKDAESDDKISILNHFEMVFEVGISTDKLDALTK